MMTMESFFRRFEQLSAESNAAELTALYAPAFLLAGPGGSQVVRAADLQPAIVKRKDLFTSLGCTATRLVAVDERVLDDRYSLARTEWQWRFEPSRDAVVEFSLPASYLIERSDDRWQIVAYMPHADIIAELRRRGLPA